MLRKYGRWKEWGSEHLHKSGGGKNSLRQVWYNGYPRTSPDPKYIRVAGTKATEETGQSGTLSDQALVVANNFGEFIKALFVLGGASNFTMNTRGLRQDIKHIPPRSVEQVNCCN